MAETFDIPSYPVVVYGSLEKPIRISPGSGQAYVNAKPISEPVVVTQAVSLSGYGTVSTSEVEEPKKPRKPRPSEAKKAKKAAPKAKAAKPKRPAKKRKG